MLVQQKIFTVFCSDFFRHAVMEGSDHARIASHFANLRRPGAWNVDAFIGYQVVSAKYKEPRFKVLGPYAITAAVMRKVLIEVGLCLGERLVAQETSEFFNVLWNLRILDGIAERGERAILKSHGELLASERSCEAFRW